MKCLRRRSAEINPQVRSRNKQLSPAPLLRATFPPFRFIHLYARIRNATKRRSPRERGGAGRGAVQGVLVNMSAEMHRPESRPPPQLVELFSAPRPGTAFRISLYDLPNSFYVVLFQSHFVTLSHTCNKLGSKGINISNTWF